ncbi:MAG TPA: PAS domain S-box protein [Vicinamibacterales bacterium]|nr:PAS domain S-box protein [Vicinamibacterales bacterium]
MKGRARRGPVVKKGNERRETLRRARGPAISTRRLEDALRASAARLNKAEAIAHLGSWELDLATNTLSWSDEVYRIFGLQPQEFPATYEAFLQAVHPDDRAAVDAAYTSSLREGRDSYEIEHRIVRPSTGQIRTVHEKCEHLRNAAGQIVGSVGMVHDITDRKRAEAVLAESRRKTTTILESITDCCFELDADGRFTYVNERARAFYRRPLEQLLGRSYAEVFPVARGSVVEVFCRQVIAEQQAVHFETKSVVNDRWAEFHACPSDGGVTVYFRDITDRKQAEEALRISEARLKTIVENLTEGLVVTDIDGTFLHWNPAAIAMHGFASLDEGRKKLPDFESIFELTSADGRILPLEEWPLARILRGERLRDLEIAVRRRADGRRRVFSYGGDLVRDADGHPLLAVVSLTDVTDRKLTEQSLREANERLREADRHKNEFLAMLSHELRNPLAAIRNSLFILERTPPGSNDARVAREVIDRQVGRLVRLVDDLLDVTRISRNKIHLELQPLELNDLVRRTVADQRPAFEQSAIQLETAVPESPIVVMADRERLAQVISNLLHNAGKFTPEGGRVRVSVEAEGAARQAVIRVADTGAGMPADVVTRVFEPFMQAEHTRARSHGGLGLGLALAKGLIDLHGGAIAAESEGVGKGSLFTVRLPLSPAGAAVAPAVPQAAERRARRILLIEDDTDAAETLRQMLEFMGHTVTLVRDGATGVAQARALRPDAVLCDIGLPGMDGYEVARAIRDDDDLRHVLLLAVSGYASALDVERAAAAGFDAHVAKPPSPERLAALLGSVLAGA